MSTPEERYTHFGDAFRAFWKDSNIPLTKIATLSQVPHNTLKKWGRGDTRYPQNWTDIVQAAHAMRLNVSKTDTLLQLAGYPKLVELQESSLDKELQLIIQVIQGDFSNSYQTAGPAQPAVTEHVDWPLHVNVPPIPNLFVGRDELVADLVERLISSHTLAISSQRVPNTDKTKIAMDGLPGIGKTAMAIVLAHHPAVLNYFTDGVLWGGLGQQSGAMHILSQWGDKLGEDVSGLETEKERAQAIRSAIGQRRMLVVIDDAWDVKSANYLRCGGPNCCHLLTTRNFQVAREFAGLAQIETIPVLDEIASWQLLEVLAPEVCKADSKSVQSLIDRAGGLPLTLVLLGGFLAAPEHSMFEDLSLETLRALDELSDPLDPMARLQLAMERLGTLDDAELTLQETIALSLEVLPEEMQRTFYALGAFAPKPEWFGREAAEVVAETSSRILAILVARNLMERISDTELALHQTLADFARTGTQANTIVRHREHYLSIVNEDRENWHQIEPVYNQIKWAWARHLEITNENKDPFEFIWSIRLYQERRGLAQDKLDWCMIGLQIATEQAKFREIVLMSIHIGLAYDALGDKELALDFLTSSLFVAKLCGDKSLEANLLGNIGTIYDSLGEVENALEYYNRSLPLRVETGDKVGEATTLSNIGVIYNSVGRKQEALEHYKQVLRIQRSTDIKAGQAVTLANIAAVYSSLGDKQTALNYHERALSIHREVGNKVDEAKVLTNMGADCEYSEIGLEYLNQALLLHFEIGNKEWQAATLANISQKLLSQGKHQEALENLNQALLLQRQVGDKRGRAISLSKIATVYQVLNDNQQALKYYDLAVELKQELGDKQGEATDLVSIGGIHFSLGDLSKAFAYFKRSFPLWHQIEISPDHISMLTEIGRKYAFAGKYDDAIHWFRLVLPRLHKLDDKAGEATILTLIGGVYVAMAKNKEALDYLNPAVSLRREIGDNAEEFKLLTVIKNICRSLGDSRQEINTFDRLLELARLTGDTASEAGILYDIGTLYFALQDIAQALSYFEQAVSAYIMVGDKATEAATLGNIGVAHQTNGNKQLALEYYEKALALHREADNYSGEITTLFNIGEVYEEQDDLEKALNSYQRAYELLVQHDHYSGQEMGRQLTLKIAFIQRQIMGRLLTNS